MRHNNLSTTEKKEVLTGCCDYQVLDLRFVECKLCCYDSIGLGQRRGKHKAAMHRKKQEQGENAARDSSSIIITRSSNRSIGKPLSSLITNTFFVTRLWERIKAVVRRNAGYFKRQPEYISRSMSAGMRDISLTSH